jgi:hypothetical protein
MKKFLAGENLTKGQIYGGEGGWLKDLRDGR